MSNHRNNMHAAKRCRKVTTFLRAFAAWALLPTAVMALGVISGCADLDIRKDIPWGESKDEKYGEPAKVVVMWADAMLNQPEKKGVRGFGGRLYFYGKDPSKPIKVKGTLVIYAFDETNRAPENVVPDKKFVFTSAQLEKHYSKNDVGASYSVWLPWDELGGAKKEVSLIARFTSDKGNLVISDQTKQELPGMPTASKPSSLPSPLPVSLPPGAPQSASLNPASPYPGVQTSYQQSVVESHATTTSAATQTPNMAAPSPMALLAAAQAAPDALGSPAPAMHNTTTISLPANRMTYARQDMMGSDQMPSRTIPQQSALMGTPPTNPTGIPVAPGVPAAVAPPGVATTTVGVLPSNSWPNRPGWNPSATAGFPGTPNPAAPGSPASNLGNPMNAGGLNAAPVGWNATAPWNAGSNPVGMLNAPSGNVSPNGSWVTTSGSGVGPMQIAGPAATQAGWSNTAVPSATIPNRQAPVTPGSTPASY